MLFWAIWGFALGVLITLRVRRWPTIAEYRRFLQLLGARGSLLDARTRYYLDARSGVAEWRRRRYWKRRVARAALSRIARNVRRSE